jgi:hypothetical protein
MNTPYYLLTAMKKNDNNTGMGGGGFSPLALPLCTPLNYYYLLYFILG